MTTENDFLIVANSATNIEALATYAADSVIANGVVSGTASSSQVNRIFRQATSGMGLLGAFMASQGVAAIDSGSESSLATAFQSALAAYIAANVTTVPSGQIIMVASPTPPSGYILADGSSYAMSAHPTLAAALVGSLIATTSSSSTAATYSSSTFSGASVAPQVGWYVVGNGVAAGTTIAAVSGSSLTFSAAATASNSGATFSISPYSVTTTNFSVPDLRGEFVRGVDNGRGVDPSRTLGSTQASAIASHTVAITDPGHSHTYGMTTAGTTTGSQILGVSNGTTLEYSTNASVTGITASYTGASETRPTNVALLACIKT